MQLKPVELTQSHRLINHGPTVMISAKHDGVANVMSAAWACALDFSPPKVSVVIDKGAYTRGLVEKSGWFALQVPVAGQVAAVMSAGRQSRYGNPAKLADCGMDLFYQEGFDVPLVQGCAAYLVCRLLPEPHNQQSYDLFIGEVAAAWADERVYADGRWRFDDVPDELKTLHYIGNGQLYLIGKGLQLGKA